MRQEAQWGQGASECCFGSPAIQVQGYICEYPLPKVIIWAQYTWPHDGDPGSGQHNSPLRIYSTLRKHSLVWSLWCPKLLIENSSVGLGLSSPLSLIVPRISQKPKKSSLFCLLLAGTKSKGLRSKVEEKPSPSPTRAWSGSCSCPCLGLPFISVGAFSQIQAHWWQPV